MKGYKSNKYHIPLQKLPITVGKMAGAVDLVLNDQSISRLHARISRDGNRFFITDISINLLKLLSSQGIVGEKSFVASR